MVQPAGNPKIEELRARVKADPRSRLFYPLAEELRKVGELQEAETVLTAGLASNATYLSAWVSLGRVQKDLGKHAAAIEALNKALTFDRENVVAARLLADLYLETGEKVEAIKKFKLVHALLPQDLEVEARINQLDRELNPPQVSRAEGPATDSGFEEQSPPFAQSNAPAEGAAGIGAADEGVAETEPAVQELVVEPSPFMPSDEDHLWQEDVVEPGPPAVEPPHREIAEEPAAEASRPELKDEEPEVPLVEEERLPAPADDLTATATMGDLYAQQGYYDSAREIYEKILVTHPDSEEVKAKLRALPVLGTADHATQRDVVTRKLHDWLAKVARRDAIGRV